MGRIIDLISQDHSQAGITHAKEILISGGIVAYPTESFYGLAVDAMNEEAIQRLFFIKKRDPDQPVLILIPDEQVLKRYVEKIPDIAGRMIEKFWPGGLTIIFKAGPVISPLLTAKSDKIGVRLSSNPIATNLSKSINSPITGTSANISGQSPCVTAQQVDDSFGNSIDLILDGGETKGGKGSTIIDSTVKPIKIVREGMISINELNKSIES
jgi:L-threonylcarbamoyladenylate synthase